MNELFERVLDALSAAEYHMTAVCHDLPNNKLLGDLHLAIVDVQRKARKISDEAQA